MATDNSLFDGRNGSDEPFSRFSLRRYSVQQVLLIFAIIGLLIATNVHGALDGSATLIALAGVTLGVMLVMTGIVIHAGTRVVEVEVWIRRLGMGDFQYRIEPWGRDEISETCRALETLRQSSIRAMRLDLVQELSDKLQDKNAALEHTLDELRSAQDRIVSQQKLAELGELSAGVAHEIRNPLQFIRNFAEASELTAKQLRELSEGGDGIDLEEVGELTRDIEDSMGHVVVHSDRADRIVGDMLALGRRGTGTFSTVDLNSLLSDQIALAHKAVQAQEPGFAAKVHHKLAPDVGEVSAVPEDLARVFTNLVTNACQAMAERSAASEGGYQPELWVETRRTPEHLVVTIRDNGPGMPDEVMAKIFNPFFTTKEGSHSTGLGLSLSHDIVREHGGQLAPASEPGVGTKFTVLLPLDPEHRGGIGAVRRAGPLSEAASPQE